ncbi:hypothetical protein E2C01_049961 [Portunus trituberculatus]|uniref:Uncharacterized protein n=1 Tax=Portunus trituberculatus TaxID=210409 RepID=A0A5B7GF91_PORTR|nr:hypothetical protein [Portunus trituberculatus]
MTTKIVVQHSCRCGVAGRVQLLQRQDCHSGLIKED